jgi:hypothetical protein
MWAQWVLALGAALAAVVAVIVFVENASPTAQQPIVSRAAIAEDNREAAILVRQDQRPHVVRVARGTGARVAITRAVAAYMSAEIARGILVGPLTRTGCRPRRGASPSEAAYACVAVAAHVSYPFLGVAGRGRVTYCKRDPPPVPSMDIPVSRACR